jgi:ketosteroid isomerase-like protein
MASTPGAAEGALDRFLIREVIERYLVALDDQDWDGIADCFTDDAVSHYNHEPQDLIGGRGVAEFLKRMQAYTATNHILSRIVIEVDGDEGVAHFKTVAVLHVGEVGVGRVQVRSVAVVDRLRRIHGRWLITERLHAPDFQFDAVSAPTVLLDT